MFYEYEEINRLKYNLMVAKKKRDFELVEEIEDRIENLIDNIERLGLVYEY